MTVENQAKVRQLFPGIDDITDQKLRSVVLRAWGRTIKECGFKRLEDIPFSVTAPGVSLLDHINLVLDVSLHMACSLEDKMGIKVNQDLLIAAVLLHDLGKAYEYRRAGKGFTKTEIGESFMHGFWGTHVSLLEGAPLELAHLISTHCHGSPVHPRLLEGVILHYADFAHADIIRFQNKMPLFLAENG